MPRAGALRVAPVGGPAKRASERSGLQPAYRSRGTHHDEWQWQRRAVRSWHERGLRSEEHTSELQSHLNLVCRLLLEKKKRETKPILIRGSNRHTTDVSH